VLVNIHHHRSLVESFLAQPHFTEWVHGVFESQLLGTAGTLGENAQSFLGFTTLLVHADNWCQCDLKKFLNFHHCSRPIDSLITMMTFRTPTPHTCGVVEVDSDGIVQRLYEKVTHPPDNLANGAVYLLEPEVVRWVSDRPALSDFSTEVLPEFIGRIATWENTGIHRDIGQIQSLLDAQKDPQPEPCWFGMEEWMRTYRDNPVHAQLNSRVGERR
jgi:mannose-1-phosphate guanylyltransferase